MYIMFNEIYIYIYIYIISERERDKQRQRDQKTDRLKTAQYQLIEQDKP